MKYIAIYILNLIDWAVTLYWTGLHGISHEINPLMRWALSTPGAFTIIKLILFPLLLLWMWRKKHEDTAWFTLGAFSAVFWLNINTILGT